MAKEKGSYLDPDWNPLLFALGLWKRLLPSIALINIRCLWKKKQASQVKVQGYWEKGKNKPSLSVKVSGKVMICCLKTHLPGSVSWIFNFIYLFPFARGNFRAWDDFFPRIGCTNFGSFGTTGWVKNKTTKAETEIITIKHRPKKGHRRSGLTTW